MRSVAAKSAGRRYAVGDLPERDPGSFGRDLLSVGIQVAVVVGGPLLVAAYVGDALDRQLGTTPWLGLLAIFVGLGVAGVGMFLVIRRYIRMNPVPPTSDAAREAGRQWQREIEERERRREGGDQE